MAEVLLFQPAMSIVDRIVCSVIDEFKLRRVSHKDLQTLKNKLIYLQAFIHNAGSQNYAEKRAIVNLWLKKVMDVAYYVEDVLDEYAYDGHQRKVEGRFVLYRSLTDFSVSNPVAFKIRMANKVNRATAMFEEIFKEAQNLGIKPVKLTENEWNLPTPAYEEFREEREFASYISGFVGRKYDELKLVKMLSNQSPENKISIVAIVGIGGLGKTTLARRVYDSVTIKEHFARRVWICVSKTFSVTRLLNEMVESLTRNRCGVSNVEATERVLQNELEGQKYLLVLDDVWNTGQGRWESLMSSLYGIGGSLGSTILVTTRSHEVVETVQAPTVHELQRLSEEESWSLFEQIVFRNETARGPSDLVVIGKKIVEKCKGVPLALKMLAQLLTSEKDAQKWKSIEQSEIWELPQDRFGILPSLLLSFYHLPSSVKQCFSYCAIFKKDTVMSKNDLIRLWLAQGLLHQTSRGKSAEDIGEEYFNMLLGNSFLQFKSRDYLSLDIKCTMHDLVHDMAMLVCQTDCLIWKEENEIEDAFGVRHLALIGENLETVSGISTNKKLSKLRTLHSQISINNNLLIIANHLRVLKLSGIDLKDIPVSIGGLKHCRYLDLSGNAIEALPDSITKLYNLQTLQLQGCPFLRIFPKGMSKLVNLRHHQTEKFVEMPAGMKLLTHLQTLPFLSLQHSRGGTIDEIGYLHDVRGRLYIEGLEFVRSKEASMKANIGKKAAIVALGLRWSAQKDYSKWLNWEYHGMPMSGGIKRVKDGSTDEDVLDSLRPHPNLKRLEVVDYEGEKFPSWMIRMTVVDEMGKEAPLNNLVDIFLTNCKKCKKLPTLGQLPSLKQLIIEKMVDVNHIGAEFYGYCEASDNGGNVGKRMLLFPALRTLYIRNFHGLIEWLPAPKETTVPFPCLEDLKISHCPRLIATPTHFPCLKKLSLTSIGSKQPLDIITNNIRSLRSLQLTALPHVTGLPRELGESKNFVELEVTSCSRLVGLADTLQNLVSLKTLRLQKCTSLTSLPRFNEYKSLRRLEITGCDGLSRIPSGLEYCTSLNTLWIDGCSNIEAVPNLRQLSRLESLYVHDCKKLTSLPEGLDCLHRLHSLSIGGFQEELECFPDVSPLSDLKSLTTLHLCGWPKLKSLPHQLQHIVALQQLEIEKFPGMEEVPEWVGNLSSLKSLKLWYCPNLKHLPSRTTMLQLRLLRDLFIFHCPYMTENCAEDIGPEWHKIAHIPYVEIS